MRDYSEEYVDAELRALGIYSANSALHTNNKIIIDHNDTLRRGGQPLPKMKPPSRSVGSLRKPSDELIHDMVVESGLPPNDVFAIWGWTVADLKQSPNNAGVSIRYNATKQGIVTQTCTILG
ncbi:MAG: hypothetical protein ACKPKO_28985, partial [Candidatus Fonsibacter sp.]